MEKKPATLYPVLHFAFFPQMVVWNRKIEIN